MRVGLEYENSSPDASHSNASSTNLNKYQNSDPSLDDMPELGSIPLMILLLLSKKHILHLLFSNKRVLCHRHLDFIDTLTILIRGINLCIEISFGMAATLLSDHLRGATEVKIWDQC
jgi:hypothetical protein